MIMQVPRNLINSLSGEAFCETIFSVFPPTLGDGLKFAIY
jgi:hypothetical protein